MRPGYALWSQHMFEAHRPTIFALSSGRPPAAIAVVRISGPRARDGLAALAPKIPEPRRAALRRLRDPVTGSVLDEALVLWLPGPATETGEDMVELHLHGGRAVVADRKSTRLNSSHVSESR